MNDRLANEKISSLLLSLAIPSILAQLATLIYNMVDRIYIGRLANGSLSIAGVGYVVLLLQSLWHLQIYLAVVVLH